MSKKAIKVFVVALGLVSFAAHSSFACSVCAVANEETRYAYYATTAFLTLLPLFMIGGIVYYIAKKGR